MPRHRKKRTPLQVLECHGISERPNGIAWVPVGVSALTVLVAVRFLGRAALLLIPILGFACLMWMARLFVPPKLCLHEDGVRFGTKEKMRFLPFEKMIDVRLALEYTRVDERTRGMDVVFIFKMLNGHRGRFVHACYTEEGTFQGDDFTPKKAAEVDESATRMLEAIRAGIDSVRTQETDQVKAILASDTSNAASHVRRLRAIVPGKDAYRSIPIVREKLLEIIEDPNAGPRLRVSAAVVLRAAKHPGDGERVKAAASKCASPALARALDAVSDSDENDERAFLTLSEEIL